MRDLSELVLANISPHSCGDEYVVPCSWEVVILQASSALTANQADGISSLTGHQHHFLQTTASRNSITLQTMKEDNDIGIKIIIIITIIIILKRKN